MSKSSSNGQYDLTMNIHEIETGVHTLRNDTQTMIRGRTLADTIEDEQSPVSVVTEGFLSIVQGVRRCLRDGLKQKGGFTHITKVGQQSFWPFVQRVTPRANVDYVLEQVANVVHEEDDVELLEVAWIVLAINDGTLADYIQLCLETPLWERTSWYSHNDGAMMLDNAKLEILKEAAQQVCDIYFQITLEDLWYALKEDERVREMRLGDGLLAPASSPVLAGVDHPRMSIDSAVSTGESVESTHSDVPQLRRYSEGAQIQHPTDKETLRREAEDLDQIMTPRRTSSLRSTISSIREKTIDAANDLLSSAINVAEKQAEKLRRRSRALSGEHSVDKVEAGEGQESSQDALQPQGQGRNQTSSIASELPPSPPTEQVVPGEDVRVSLFERMRESFSALVGEPFDETDSDYSDVFERVHSETEHPSERIPRASSTKSLTHSEKFATKEPTPPSIHSAEPPRRPRLSSTISELSIDSGKESRVESAPDKQSSSSKKSVHG